MSYLDPAKRLKACQFSCSLKECSYEFFKYRTKSFRAFKESTDLVGNVYIEVVIKIWASPSNLILMGMILLSRSWNSFVYGASNFQSYIYNSKVDVWSLGNVFYEMLTIKNRIIPFTGSNRADLKRNLVRGSYRFPKEIKIFLESLHFLN